MRLIGLAVVLAASVLLAPRAADAQPAAKVARIGYLSLNLAASRHLPTRSGVLWQPGAVGERTEKDTQKGAEVAARALGVRLQFVEARGPADIDRAFADMTGARAGALTVWTTAMLVSERGRLVALAAKNRLPAVHTLREFVDAGGLMSYGHSQADLNRRAAIYVDKILKGVKPADLPVEQPTQFELVINLKTAKAVGLTIQQSALGRADEIIQ
jgi:putative ABC transport system substrate-binding protein